MLNSFGLSITLCTLSQVGTSPPPDMSLAVAKMLFYILATAKVKHMLAHLVYRDDSGLRQKMRKTIEDC